MLKAHCFFIILPLNLIVGQSVKDRVFVTPYTPDVINLKKQNLKNFSKDARLSSNISLRGNFILNNTYFKLGLL
jgi:hypothetical protein